MTIAVILVALLVAFIAFRFVMGVAKFGVVALVLVAVAWFLLRGHA